MRPARISPSVSLSRWQNVTASLKLIARPILPVTHLPSLADQLRFVQLTPPGSSCSIAFGEGITEAEPGSVQGLQLVTADIESERAGFLARGLDPGEVQDLAWGRFVHFTDPDGNAWSVQQIVRPADQ